MTKRLIETWLPIAALGVESLRERTPMTSAPSSAFAQRYWPYVQADPGMAMAHAGVKQAMAAWPRPPEDNASSLLHEPHRLAEKARHLARRS